MKGSGAEMGSRWALLEENRIKEDSDLKDKHGGRGYSHHPKDSFKWDFCECIERVVYRSFTA